MRERRLMFGVMVVLLLFWSTLRFGVGLVEAARISDVRGTKHNLSAAADGSTYTRPDGSIGTVPGTGTIPGTDLMPRNIKASTETQVCVFCHTPHGATVVAPVNGVSQAQGPLWNRAVAGNGYTQSYIMYDSSTLDAKQVQGALNQPGGSSKLCLSCHDGTLAIGSVNVLNGQLDTTPASPNITTTTTGGGPNGNFMPTGAGVDTGFTRNLGTDLSNDHPISVSYNAALVAADGELRTPDGSLVGTRSPGVKPKLPLEKTGVAAGLSSDKDAQLQCPTCHDPHILETQAATFGNQKFLRLNRFQQQDPPSSTGFNQADNTGDIICLACHDKGGASWAYSVHANSAVADETYNATAGGAADRREFPRGLPVWKASCLNCHDTHTVKGARRLLREGTTSAAVPKSGGNPAQEETCYQCHDGGANATLTSATNVPNIRNDFVNKLRRMPITRTGTDGLEVHDISSTVKDQVAGAVPDSFYIDCTLPSAKCGKDFVESRDKLGVGNLNNRHVECTDCHNPHRVIRGKNGLPGSLTTANTSEARVNGASGGAHAHTTGTVHTNRISGVLRGSWGVEPIYSADASFHKMPTGYTVKRGDPGSNTHTDCANGANKTACDSAGYVTREYQICLKCHSDYGYTDDNVYPSGATRPALQTTNGANGLTGGNPYRTGFTRYTNQAKEFQAPSTHRQAPASTTDSGAGSSWQTNNHRSWHPVMDSTGRGTTQRGGLSASNWYEPWNNALGSQTMYCTDCHGSDNGNVANVIPTGTNPWGPHGSDKDFLLKGVWTTSSGSGSDNTVICFKCHNSAIYTGNGTRTGFWISTDRSSNNDGHKVHNDKIGSMRCNWCHVAVPHGWKNKALLVNLNDVGPEAGQTAGTAVSTPYTNGPYYRNAMNKVKSFQPSGQWFINACGATGQDSRSWMQNTCKTPP